MFGCPRLGIHRLGNIIGLCPRVVVLSLGDYITVRLHLQIIKQGVAMQQKQILLKPPDRVETIYH